MESYNRKIADQILYNELKMLNHTSQPEMLKNEFDGLNSLHENCFHGGSRTLQYVLPGNSVQSSEPSTLSVGKHPFENTPNHLIQGGNLRKNCTQGGNIFDSIGEVAKTVAPIAIPMMMAAGLPEDEKKKKRGRPRKSDGGSFFDTLGSVAKAVAPVAQQVAVPVAQQMLTNYLTKGSSKGAGLDQENLMVDHF